MSRCLSGVFALQIFIDSVLWDAIQIGQFSNAMIQSAINSVVCHSVYDVTLSREVQHPGSVWTTAIRCGHVQASKFIQERPSVICIIMIHVYDITLHKIT